MLPALSVRIAVTYAILEPAKKGTSTVPVSFADIKVGSAYSRGDLVRLWGYAGVEAISRGVVTPRDDNKIVLFVTLDKDADAEQYEDELVGSVLLWEGPNDHYAEDRPDGYKALLARVRAALKDPDAEVADRAQRILADPRLTMYVQMDAAGL